MPRDDVLDRSLAEVMVTSLQVHADDGVSTHLQRLLAQTVERAAPGQVPGVGRTSSSHTTAACHW